MGVGDAHATAGPVVTKEKERDEGQRLCNERILTPKLVV